jgi:hypothetical protein
MTEAMHGLVYAMSLRMFNGQQPHERPQAPALKAAAPGPKAQLRALEYEPQGGPFCGLCCTYSSDAFSSATRTAAASDAHMQQGLHTADQTVAATQ